MKSILSSCASFKIEISNFKWGVLLLLASVCPAPAANFTINMILSGGKPSFSPSNQTVNVGDTVAWVNQTFLGHDTVSGIYPTPSGVWNSDNVFPSLVQHNDAFSFTFNVPAGSYPYFC